MRIFSISPSGVTETDTLPTQLPAQGFVWLACARGEFEAMHTQIQATLQALTGSTGLDGALDPREHLRQSGPHAVDVALGRSLGLLRPALAGPDRTLMDTHLGPGDAFGMDPWWLAPRAG